MREKERKGGEGSMSQRISPKLIISELQPEMDVSIKIREC